MLLAGILTAVGWICVWGFAVLLAASLESKGTDTRYDRWFVRPFLLLWIVGGAFLCFATVGLGWFR